VFHQPILFFSLYAGHKLLNGTKIREFSDFENEYFLSDVGGEIHEDEDDDKGSGRSRLPTWRFVLGEIYSFIS
jgi:hypothetical protein